jgi:uncharacterized membrane protein YhaH (DUF805 family)
MSVDVEASESEVSKTDSMNAVQSAKKYLIVQSSWIAFLMMISVLTLTSMIAGVVDNGLIHQWYTPWVFVVSTCIVLRLSCSFVSNLAIFVRDKLDRTKQD